MIDLATIQQHTSCPGPIFPGPAPRGFAAMTREQRDRIASMGGKAAHAKGRAHEFTSDEARAAAKVKHQRKGA